MQSYGDVFSRIYDRKWTAFVTGLAPLIAAHYETLEVSRENRRILDVCCGTGQLLSHFLERGYTGAGVDASASMLARAERNNKAAVADGRLSLLVADAAAFQAGTGFGLAVSTFDALNHLNGETALAACFRRVHDALAPGGLFLFDLNTITGLRRWNNIMVDESDDMVIVNRGLFTPDMDRAYTRITGFLRTESGLYERFEETAYNTPFRMDRVRDLLAQAGFARVRRASRQALGTELPDPEAEARVYFGAERDAAH
jgi:SAM-dependent methyltransferase